MFSDSGRVSTTLLAWYFAIVRGVGFIATKTALRYTGPFMLLTLRFAIGAFLLLPIRLARPGTISAASPRVWIRAAHR